MTSVAAGAHLEGGLRLAAVLLVGYLLLGQPLVGAWSHDRFRRRRATDPRALLGRYRRTAAREWSRLAAALALVAAAPGLDLADIGVRWPGLGSGRAPYTLVAAAGLAVPAALLAGLRRRVDRGTPVTAPAEVLMLLPRTVPERRAFALVAVTAAGCEEALYRGVLLGVAIALRPGLPAGWLAVLSAAAFGLAHSYQGVLGVLGTAVLGGCLAVLYLGSASLLLPALYHLLVDLRMLVLAVGRHGPAARRRQAANRPGRHAARGPGRA